MSKGSEVKLSCDCPELRLLLEMKREGKLKDKWQKTKRCPADLTTVLFAMAKLKSGQTINTFHINSTAMILESWQRLKGN